MSYPPKNIPSPLLPASTSGDADDYLTGNGSGIQTTRQIATVEQRRIIEPWSRKKPYRKLSYEEQLWLQRATGMDEYRLINFFQNARARENKRRKLERQESQTATSAEGSTSTIPAADSISPRPSPSTAFNGNGSQVSAPTASLQGTSQTEHYRPRSPPPIKQFSTKREWEGSEGYSSWPPVLPFGIALPHTVDAAPRSGTFPRQEDFARSTVSTTFTPYPQVPSNFAPYPQLPSTSSEQAERHRHDFEIPGHDVTATVAGSQTGRNVRRKSESQSGSAEPSSLSGTFPSTSSKTRRPSFGLRHAQAASSPITYDIVEPSPRNPLMSSCDQPSYPADHSMATLAGTQVLTGPRRSSESHQTRVQLSPYRNAPSYILATQRPPSLLIRTSETTSPMPTAARDSRSDLDPGPSSLVNMSEHARPQPHSQPHASIPLLARSDPVQQYGNQSQGGWHGLQYPTGAINTTRQQSEPFGLHRLQPPPQGVGAWPGLQYPLPPVPTDTASSAVSDQVLRPNTTGRPPS